LLNPSFNLLKDGNRGLQNNPDTVDDLFRLCNRFVEKCPVEFASHTAFKPLLECAILCLKHQHREANASTCKFIKSVLTCNYDGRQGGDASILEQIAATFGYEIINQSLNACLFYIQSYMYPDIAELWWALMPRKQLFTEWLQESLRNLPANQTYATATMDQIKTFLLNVCKAQEWKQVSYLLRDFCRLYR